MKNGGGAVFENASIEETVNIEDKVILVSTEIPIIYSSNSGRQILTPFMEYQSMNGLEGIQMFGHQYRSIIRERNDVLSDYKDLVDFIDNNNSTVACKLINSGYGDVDCATVSNIRQLYKFLPNVFGDVMVHVLPKNYDKDIYSKLIELECLGPIANDADKITKVLSKCRELYSFDRDLIASLRLLIKYIENIEPFFPVMVLANDLGSRQESISEYYQITTFSYAELKEFYIEAFELLSRLTILYKGLLATIDSGDPDSHNGRFAINSLSDFASKDNGIKKDIIADDGRLDSYFSFLLDNQIRNGIGHVKTEYIQEGQIIRYYPYRGAGKKDNFKEITLTNLAYRSHMMLICVYDGVRLISSLHA